MRVVDPDRPALAEGDEAELLAEPWDEVKARLDVVAEVDVARRGSLEQCGRGDMHVRPVTLQVQKGAVEPCQTIGHSCLMVAYQVCAASQKCANCAPTLPGQPDTKRLAESP